MDVAEVVEETEPIIILDPEQEELGKRLLSQIASNTHF